MRWMTWADILVRLVDPDFAIALIQLFQCVVFAGLLGIASWFTFGVVNSLRKRDLNG